MTAGGTVDVRNRASEFKAKIVPCVFRKPAVTSIASPRLALIDSANRADLVVLRRVRRPPESEPFGAKILARAHGNVLPC
jgi:hypothetical protein